MELEKLRHYLTQHHDRFVRELCDYVQIPSISAQPDHRRDMEVCAHWLRDHCRNIGLEAQVIATAGHPIVLAKTPPASPGAPRFLVYGHYDVQPVDPLDLWQTEPFQPQIRHGALFARGASDNKANTWLI